jgi:hypothetical protein
VAYSGFFFSDVEEKKLIHHIKPPMDLGYEKSEALNYLNDIREAMGMNTLIYHEELAIAAQAHAEYLVRNQIASHSEKRGVSSFTGETPAERAIHAGYLSRYVSENLSVHNMDAKTSIDGLFSAIYHRFGFLDFGIDEVGVGVAQNPKKPDQNAFVYLMGTTQINTLCTQTPFKGYGKYVYGICKKMLHRIAQKDYIEAKQSNKQFNPKMILYPYDGQSDVPPVFYDEIPDPLPDYEVSGFPISIAFNDYFFHSVKLLSFSLHDGEGKAVDNVRILTSENDPHQKLKPQQFALLPLTRLKYDTEYRATIVYMENNKKRSRSWQFHTRKTEGRLVRVSGNEQTIEMNADESLFIYLVPANGHDIPREIIFPENTLVSFVDNHTLRVQLLPANQAEHFEIKSNHHILHIQVKRKK